MRTTNAIAFAPPSTRGPGCTSSILISCARRPCWRARRASQGVAIAIPRAVASRVPPTTSNTICAPGWGRCSTTTPELGQGAAAALEVARGDVVENQHAVGEVLPGQGLLDRRLPLQQPIQGAVELVGQASISDCVFNHVLHAFLRRSDR